MQNPGEQIVSLPLEWSVSLLGGEMMTGSSNGRPTAFTINGQIMADGGLVGVHMRWASSSGSDPEGQDHPWIPGLIALASTGNAPQGKRSDLLLTQEDAKRFGIADEPTDAVALEVEVKGEGGNLRLTATVRGIFKSGVHISILGVDPTIGALHIDGPARTWTWTVPQ